MAQCLYFDGVDDQAVIPDNAAYSISTTGKLTVSCWVRVDEDNMPISYSSGYVNFISKCTYGSPNKEEWEFRVYNTDNTETNNRGREFSFYTFNPTGDQGVSGDTLRDYYKTGDWIFLVGQCDMTRATIWANGRKRESALLSAYSIVPEDTDSVIYLGRGGEQTGIARFKGCIRDLRIWNTILTDTQIQTVYLRGTNVAPANLVGWWKMDEGTGTTLIDSSTTGNNGTITGATYLDAFTQPKRPSLAFPSRNYIVPATTKAIVLTGATNYASITDANQTGLDLGEEDFMICFWARHYDKVNTAMVCGKVDTGHANASTTAATGWDILYSSSRYFGLRMNNGSGSSYSITAVSDKTVDGNWHHYAFVVRRGSNAECWIDGQYYRNSDWSAKTGTISNNGPFMLGATQAGASIFRGNLRQLIIYKFGEDGLPTNYRDILWDIYCKNVVSTTGLVSRWELNNDLTDSFGTNHLTATGSPTYAVVTTARTAATRTAITQARTAI